MRIDTVKEVVEWLKIFRDGPVTFTSTAGSCF